MHDQSAEVADAPMLIVRLAQDKGSWTKLHQFLRVDSGLGSEGQISHATMQKGLHHARLNPLVPPHQIDEVFATLDPEATGTIGFSELTAELRRVRKSIAPSSPVRRLPRGGSAPVTRSRAPGGLQHEDGSSYSAHELERAAVGYRRQGELGQALRALEGALAIHSRLHGPTSDVAIECSRQVADVCNSLGMQMLQRDDFVGCHALLKRAQARGQGDRAMYAITLNNLACYHRRRGHLKVALAHLCKAVDIEAHCEAHKPADTHLNLCAVQSELGNHHEAMYHAKLALRLLRDELGLPPPASPYARPGSAPPMSSSGMLTGGGAAASAGRFDGAAGGGEGVGGYSSGGGGYGQPADAFAPQPSAPRPSAERMAVLAIAHHNLAVEQEALRLPEEASRSFAEAASIAIHQLGAEHPVAVALRATHEANVQARERKAMEARMAASGRSQNRPRANSAERQAAELRKQESMRMHIEKVRFLRANSGKMFIRKPHEKKERDTTPKILADVGVDGDVASALREW